MPTIHIIRPGLMTTVQDLGRHGYLDRGLPVAGAMDLYSLRAANRLVGNHPSDAALEIALTGPEIAFDTPTRIAVCGAPFQMTLDGEPLEPHTVAVAPGGARLVFGERLRGARAYLAFAGGIDVVPVLGSRSTDLASRLGGFEGRALKAGDRLPVVAVRSRPALEKPPKALALSGGTAVLRVMMGPHIDRFPPGIVDVLTTSTFVVSAESNRMGYRLDGPPLAWEGDELLSCATPPGGLQATRSGSAVLLMADRGTTGGYPIIATVISADVPLAAQLAPGDSLRFEACTLDASIGALRRRERDLLGEPG